MHLHKKQVQNLTIAESEETELNFRCLEIFQLLLVKFSAKNEIQFHEQLSFPLLGGLNSFYKSHSNKY